MAIERSDPQVPRHPLILVSGGTRTLREILPHPSLGVLLTPDISHPCHLALVRPGVPWAADNSAFTNFDPARFCGFLSKVARVPGCLWATCPDAVADARETLARFAVWQPVMAAVGLPVAYVAQDGSEQLDLPWGRVACLFVGGSTGWKESLTARDLMAEAKRRGRWVHVGRVNSERRIRLVVEWGADSIDGSGFGKWPATNIPKGLRWLSAAARRAEAIATVTNRRPVTATMSS